MRSFTLIELLIVSAVTGVIAVVVIACCTLCAGNFWFTEDGVRQALAAEYKADGIPVRKIERHVFGYSVIWLGEDRRVSSVQLDTNILFNYRFRDRKYYGTDVF